MFKGFYFVFRVSIDVFGTSCLWFFFWEAGREGLPPNPPPPSSQDVDAWQEHGQELQSMMEQAGFPIAALRT